MDPVFRTPTKKVVLVRRRPNFTESEIKILICEVAKRKTVLFSNIGNGITTEGKKNAWEEITRAVNSVSDTQRLPEELKKKLSDLKCLAKKKDTARRKEACMNGGVTSGSNDLSPWEELLIAAADRSSTDIQDLPGFADITRTHHEDTTDTARRDMPMERGQCSVVDPLDVACVLLPDDAQETADHGEEQRLPSENAYHNEEQRLPLENTYYSTERKLSHENAYHSEDQRTGNAYHSEDQRLSFENYHGEEHRSQSPREEKVFPDPVDGEPPKRRWKRPRMTIESAEEVVNLHGGLLNAVQSIQKSSELQVASLQGMERNMERQAEGLARLENHIAGIDRSLQQLVSILNRRSSIV